MTSLEIARLAPPLFGLAPAQNAEFVPGGLTHRLMRVESENAIYALKLWSARATTNAQSRARLEQSETLASLAAQSGIPALCALPGQNGQFLQTANGRFVSLYPWISGEILPPSAASPARCQIMGAHLGALHALKLRFAGQEEPAPEAFEIGHFAEIARDARAVDAPFAEQLQAALDELEAANAVAMRAQMELRDGWVTGHLDFDQKNVLWRGEEPTILDWENAKPIHPALELVGAGLSWAGQSAGAPNRESFAAFLRGYRAANEVDEAALDLAIDGVLGKWIIWLEFNLQRMLEPEIQGTPELQIALDAGLHALDATLQLRRDGRMYREWIG